MSFCLACGGANTEHAIDCQRRPSYPPPTTTVRLSDEDRAWLKQLVTESVTLAVEAAKTPRFGWNSTGSSWVRARGLHVADCFTDDPNAPPPYPPRGPYAPAPSEAEKLSGKPRTETQDSSTFDPWWRR